MLRFSILILALLLSTSVQGQSALAADQNRQALELGFAYGKIIKHRDYFRPTITRPTVNLEASYNLQTRGEKYWHQLHNYPKFRFKAVVSLFGDREVFGTGIGLLPMLRFERKLAGLQMEFDVGMGIAYVSKVYDDFDNPVNNVISAHINNITQMSCLLSYPLGSRSRVKGGGSFTHFSNGKFRSPNLGINILALNLAYEIELSKKENESKPLQSTLPAYRRWGSRILLGFGIREGEKEGGPRFPLYTISTQLHFQRNLKGRHLLSLDLRHFRDIYHANRQHLAFPDRYFERSVLGLVFIGHEFLMSPFSISLQTGAELISPENRVPSLENRLGKVKIGVHSYPFSRSKNPSGFCLGAHLTAEYAKATFVELNLGWYF